MNPKSFSKAIAAGVGATIAAFVPLAAGVTNWAIIADVGAALGAGLFAALSTFVAPANKPK